MQYLCPVADGRGAIPGSPNPPTQKIFLFCESKRTQSCDRQALAMPSQCLPLQFCQPLTQEVTFRTGTRTVSKALIQARPTLFKQRKNAKTQKVAIEPLISIAGVIKP